MSYKNIATLTSAQQAAGVTGVAGVKSDGSLIGPSGSPVSGGGTMAALRSTLFSGARDFWIMVGDSHTVGAGASNASTTAFAPSAMQVIGSARVIGYSNAGVAGNKTADVVTRLSAIVATAQAAGATRVNLLIGTNDASVPVSLFGAGGFAENYALIVTTLQAAGLSVQVCTVPPRSSTAAASVHKTIDQYNLWLRWFAAKNNLALAEIHAALVDTATGYLASANDSGDGTHMSDAGHIKAALAVGAAANAKLRPPGLLPLVDGTSAGWGLVPRPDAPNTTGWAINYGAAGFVSLATSAAVGADLPYGNWITATVAAASGAGAAGYGLSISSGFAVGDKMLFVAKVKDSSGVNSRVNVEIRNQSNTPVSYVFAPYQSGYSGEIASVFAVPAGTTTLKPSLSFSWANADSFAVSIGNFQLLNLTAMGLDSLVF